MSSVYKVIVNGTIFYYNEKNIFHREDGPAIECSNGDKEYWIDGERHREDGPAIEYSNGTKYWYINGKSHREDGPALYHYSGYKEYWLNGERYDEVYNITSDEEWIELVPKILLLG